MNPGLMQFILMMLGNQMNNRPPNWGTPPPGAMNPPQMGGPGTGINRSRMPMGNPPNLSQGRPFGNPTSNQAPSGFSPDYYRMGGQQAPRMAPANVRGIFAR